MRRAFFRLLLVAEENQASTPAVVKRSTATRHRSLHAHGTRTRAAWFQVSRSTPHTRASLTSASCVSVWGTVRVPDKSSEMRLAREKMQDRHISRARERRVHMEREGTLPCADARARAHGLLPLVFQGHS